MVLIIVFIIFIGLMDLLAIITMIQEHRQNKKDYFRGVDDGYQLAIRQHSLDKMENLKKEKPSDG